MSGIEDRLRNALRAEVGWPPVDPGPVGEKTPKPRQLLRLAGQGRLTKKEAELLAGFLGGLSDAAHDLSDIVSSYTDGAYTRADVQGETERLRDTLRADWGWDL